MTGTETASMADLEKLAGLRADFPDYDFALRGDLWLVIIPADSAEALRLAVSAVMPDPCCHQESGSEARSRPITQNDRQASSV